MEDLDFYPEKPKLEEPVSKGSLSVTIFSMFLFVMAFTFLFEDQLNLILFLLLVLVIHEGGHYLFMKKFGYTNLRMLFIPLMGAFVQGKKDEYSQKESFLVVLAGPIPGVLFGALFILFAVNNHAAWGLELGFLFIFLNIMNLLPLDPLDGGQLFKLFFRNNQDLFLLIFAFISSLLIIAVGWWMDSFLIMGIGFLLGFRVRTLQKKFHMHKELDEVEVQYTTTYKLLSNRDFIKIKNVVLEHTPALKQFIEYVSEDESNPVIANQVNNVLIPPMTKDAGLIFKLSVLLLWILAMLTPILLYWKLDFSWYSVL